MYGLSRACMRVVSGTNRDRIQELPCHQPTQFALPYSQFAVMFINHRGELQAETSSCLAGYEKAIFTDEVQERFLKLVNREWQPNLHNASGMGLPAPSWYPPTQHGPAGLIPYEWQPLQSERRRRLRRVDSGIAHAWKPPSPGPPLKRTTLRVGQTQLLRKYYERAFEDFQQLNCRVIAKAYVKMVEPRKQVHFPYNGKISNTSRLANLLDPEDTEPDPEKTKPRWWPEGVKHKEPDHLHKRERIRLLVHILCELKDSHGVTAVKLKDAGLDVRRQIQPEKRLQVLDEIYYVRNQEELYLDGKISGDHMLHVSYGHMEEEVQGSVLDHPTSSSTTQTNQQPIRRSYRDIPIISEDLPHRPLRNGKRPADSECYRPISPASSTSRNSSLERGLASYSSDIDPVILSRTEPVRSTSAPQSLHAPGPTSLPDLYAQQFATQPQSTHPGFWDTLAAPTVHPQFSFSSY
ncbi:hypothetical protein BDV10DRAFT_160863 [Aspergillus recurvatus]